MSKLLEQINRAIQQTQKLGEVFLKGREIEKNIEKNLKELGF